MKNLFFSGVISLSLLAGSVFAFTPQDWRDRDDQQRRTVVERTHVDRYGHVRHARIIRTRRGVTRIIRTDDDRVVVMHRRHPRYYRYYDRQHRIP